MTSFIIAAICLGLPTLIISLGVWECWQAEKESRKLPPL